MSIITKKKFGCLKDGREAFLYTIQNRRGTALTVCDYGGHMQALKTQKQNGMIVDVVLGYDDIAVYEREDKYMGALIGRCSNRVAQGRLRVGSKVYQLECNNGANHLHGGERTGFNKKLWQAAVTEAGLKLTYTSPDGEGNYPGTLCVTVWYDVTEDNAVTIRYEAFSDADTICNLTNHTYFNLNGYTSGSVLHQQIQLFADAFTETDCESLPNGIIRDVTGTPMDLRKLTPIGRHIEDAYDQLKWAQGYDHNWVIRQEPCHAPVSDYMDMGLHKMAYAVGDQTGITLTAYTTQPGVQFYTGNYLDGQPAGKGGVSFDRRCGFCLEAQYFPNAPAHPNFLQPFLKKGELWKAQTIYALNCQ